MINIKALALFVSAAAVTTASADTCGSSSDAGCGSTSAGSSSSADTPTPTTATPVTATPTSTNSTTLTPTTTTATPTSTASSSSTDTTAAPSSTTATPSTSSAGSVDTAAPSATRSSTSSGSSTTTSDSFSSSSSTGSDSSSASSSLSSASSLQDTSSSGANAVAASTGSSSSNTGLIIGISGGAVVFLVLVVLICTRIRRKKQATKRENTPQTYRSLTTPNPMDRSATLPPPLSPHQRPSEMWEDSAIMVFRIPLDKVIVHSLVSQGGYGEVYRGMYKGESVAIKKLQPGIRNDIKQINSFLAEAKMMASIEHERLVRFIGVAWDSLRDLCVVTEFMEGGDLRSLLKQFEEEKTRSQGFDVDKLRIALHVAHALAYLHSLNPIVIHRDLKSRNILLDREWNAKLTDFGVSRENSDQTMTAGVGTTLWMAPEVMMGERYDEKADIFSFGVVLTELDSHEMPYANAKNTNSGRTLPDTAILQKVALGRLQAQFSAKAPQWLRELGTACLSLDPTQRPTAGELLYALQRRTR